MRVSAKLQLRGQTIVPSFNPGLQEISGFKEWARDTC